MKQAPARRPVSPANRLGLNYRDVPPRKVDVPIIDAHAHLRGLDDVPLYFEVAAAYGIATTLSMSPLEEVDALRQRYPGRIEFIAIPRWKEIAVTPAFQKSWIDDLEAFAAKGVRLAKFWMAPSMRQRHGLTLDHPFVREVARRAYDMGYHFMTHIADPSVWWREKYKDAAASTEASAELSVSLGPVAASEGFPRPPGACFPSREAPRF